MEERNLALLELIWSLIKMEQILSSILNLVPIGEQQTVQE